MIEGEGLGITQNRLRCCFQLLGQFLRFQNTGMAAQLRMHRSTSSRHPSSKVNSIPPSPFLPRAGFLGYMPLALPHRLTSFRADQFFL